MTRHAPIIAGILAALLLLFGVYMGNYYAMLDQGRLSVNLRQFDWQTMRMPPVYRWDHPAIPYLLAPAHELDHLIRPGYWSLTD